ncbi:GNAT family N-acetyltransferase [Rhodobacter sp. TJ_12]|uniref:GNAT family N-acetyltransferase n=1 Tax=Rhodobacter sp. TJ_12 TaxID=2029399 RepID=UPI001D91AA64|nr:GNAT family N-acetyltransferase [Rhodobacter sp. TJ_12]MBZ4024118.1 GNAT family N-acetyltransferase [Rhodobacter sp. TJ_12]
MTMQWPLSKRTLFYNISYRCLEDSDMPFLRRLYRSTREAELARVPWSEPEKQAFSDMQFNAQHAHYMKYYVDALWLIIERSGLPVGRLYLERWPSEHRIIDIALLPETRGIGIGSAVLEDLMEEAANNGKAVGIHVEKMNPAMSLYRRLGFETVEDKGVYDLLKWHPAS